MVNVGLKVKNYPHVVTHTISYFEVEQQTPFFKFHSSKIWWTKYTKYVSYGHLRDLHVIMLWRQWWKETQHVYSSTVWSVICYFILLYHELQYIWGGNIIPVLLFNLKQSIWSACKVWFNHYNAAHSCTI